MPVHIGELTTEVVLDAGQGPLSAEQLDQITEHVLRVLSVRKRDEERTRRADGVRGSALPGPRGLA